ncbi:Hypothetical_protein [Hexamita inflata]|uniref:Hypothetical_protein n=1 Tax=Hexamita inflata TaxID=28002 RepID=A0AA86U4Q8_9EUKA|nr:Hypothetical protein HINF_LOCUS25487 [Hexamita inflata]
MQQIKDSVATGQRMYPQIDRGLKISAGPSKQLGDILQNSANDISKNLIDNTLPENLRGPMNNVREQTMNSIKNFREQRQLNEKPKTDDVTMNQAKKKPNLWQKIKNGASKFWQFARKPIQGLISMVPAVGGLINQHFGGILGLDKPTSSIVQP